MPGPEDTGTGNSKMSAQKRNGVLLLAGTLAALSVTAQAQQPWPGDKPAQPQQQQQAWPGDKPAQPQQQQQAWPSDARAGQPQNANAPARSGWQQPGGNAGVQQSW